MNSEPTAVGDVDATSLFARFGFTRDALQIAGQTWLQALRLDSFPPKPSELATYVHELTHYLQYVATPYGYTLHLLRLLQNQAAIDLIRALLDQGWAIELPLSGRVPLPAGSDDTPAHQAYALWWNLDYLIAVLHGDHKRQSEMIDLFVADVQRAQVGHMPSHPLLMDLRTCFAWAQQQMTSYIHLFNAEGVRADPVYPIFPDGIDVAAITAESQRLTQTDAQDERTEVLLALLGNPYDTSAVIESAAVAAELFQSDVTFDRLIAWLARPVPPKRDAYRICLRMAIDSIHTIDIGTFLLSHMALCEVALFPPLLPQHSILRGPTGLPFEQLLPWRRFFALLSAAGKVEPMRNRADHARYVGDLVASLGWVHPDAVVQSALAGPSLVRNPIAYLYQSAQRFRQSDSTCFIGFDALLASPLPKAQEWRKHFEFIIVDYSDRTTYHRDKDFLDSMTTRYLETLGLQTVMRGDSLSIQAPYGRSEVENAGMTFWLRKRFETFFPGIDFSALRFV